MQPIQSVDEDAAFRAAKPGLRDSRGRTYAGVRQSLSPRWTAVWMQIATGWAVLILAVTLMAWTGGLFAVLFGSLVIGYATHFLMLWFHEAAHFNIHPSRRINDALANAVMGIMLLQDIRRYREVHFGHHHLLGKTGDPECSYFSPIDARFLFGAASGMNALKVIIGRDQSIKKTGGSKYLNWVSLLGTAFHLSVLAGLMLADRPVAAISWIVGIGAVFPFLAIVRQALEHRRADADPTADYTTVDHGAFSRNFGGGPIASTLGGAGFNRHLIHHWDMTLSCTCFAEMERFLLDTELADFYRSRNNTYLKTFLALWRNDHYRAR